MGRIQWIIWWSLLWNFWIFLLRMLVIFMREVLQWTSMDTTNSSNMQIEVSATHQIEVVQTCCAKVRNLPYEYSGHPLTVDWGGTPLWICWRVLRWKSQHLIWMTKMRILEACCMSWNFEAPPDSTMSAPSIETFECYFDVLKWPQRSLISWCLQSMLLKFNVNSWQPDIGIYRLLSEDQSPRPDFLLFLLVKLWCFYLWPGPKLLSEKITGVWSTAFIRFKLIVSGALNLGKFCHVCKEECQSNTLLYMKIIWTCMDLVFLYIDM